MPYLRSQSARAAMRSSRRRDTSHRPHVFSVTTRSCAEERVEGRLCCCEMPDRMWRQRRRRHPVVVNKERTRNLLSSEPMSATAVRHSAGGLGPGR